MGIQSFDPEVRRNIGRKCSPEALENALLLVENARFPHWNADLIFALPGQSDEAFFRGVDEALARGVDHISCYALTAEENAAMELPEDDDKAAVMMPEIVDFLKNRGFERYEISNFARPGCRCRHNVNVWRGGLLSAHGPTASGFDGKDRYAYGTLEEWLAGKGAEMDVIAEPARLNEIFAVNLRTSDGWTPEVWHKVPGADSWNKRLEVIAAAAANLDKNWFVISKERIALTGDGLMFWNSVAGEIFDYGT
jgi:oxygen-independent coproporphyrinogen-3 oxidase